MDDMMSLESVKNQTLQWCYWPWDPFYHKM